METATQDKLANAKASAKATFENIKELVEALQVEQTTEEALQAIQEHPLSVEVRSGWYVPSATDAESPAEYRILISTGGPAIQITGELDEYCEPKTAELECQDWFQPWTRVSWQELGYTFEELMALEHGDPSHPREIMLAYARCFYFGE